MNKLKLLILVLLLSVSCGKKVVTPISYGQNINSALGNGAIPQELLLKADEEVIVKEQSKWPDASSFRTILFLTEGTENPTPWFHLPVTSDESLLINQYIKASKKPLEIAFGFLWQAKLENPALPKGMQKDALWIYLNTLNSLNRIEPVTGLKIDIYSEYDPYDKQEEVLALWYPMALRWARFNNVPCTVSVVLFDYFGKEQVTPVYRKLKKLGGLPDYIEIHTNGITDFSKLPGLVKKWRKEFKLKVIIGEHDTPLSLKNIQTIMKAGISEIVIWQKE